MTRDELVFKYRHELGGLVTDAAFAGRTGAQMAMQMRQAMVRIDGILAEIHAELTKPPEPKPPEPKVPPKPPATSPSNQAVRK